MARESPAASVNRRPPAKRVRVCARGCFRGGDRTPLDETLEKRRVHLYCAGYRQEADEDTGRESNRKDLEAGRRRPSQTVGWSGGQPVPSWVPTGMVSWCSVCNKTNKQIFMRCGLRSDM